MAVDPFWERLVAETYFANHGFTGYRATHRWKSHVTRDLNLTISYGDRMGRPCCHAAVWSAMEWYQCDREGKNTDPAGHTWCGTHSPMAFHNRQEGKRKRAEATNARWRAEGAKRREDARKRTGFDRLAEVLRQIRDGHNDPRGLAAEVLAEFENAD